MSFIGIKPLGGIPDFSGEITGNFGKIMRKEAGVIQRMFERTTGTWESRPIFSIEQDRDNESVSIGTEDLIYFFLNYGTAERYAVMSSDFSAKTAPGVIGSGQGRGGAVIVGANSPIMEGIEARLWTKEIIKRREPKFVKNMNEEIKRATVRLAKKSNKNL